LIELNIGILSIQGDIEENVISCKESLKQLRIDGNIIQIKNYEQINDIDGLIIPGGESTVMSTIMALDNQNWEILKQKIRNGLPVFGTCAGMIILSKRAQDKTTRKLNQKLLENLDILVERNAFGRQRESFETNLNIPILGEKPFRGIFIRGPIVKEVGKDVKILAKYDNKIVAVIQNNILGTSFHPELAEDNRLHSYFINMILEHKSLKADHNTK
jgi:5'-phosphate synthase pdxT subunit